MSSPPPASTSGMSPQNNSTLEMGLAAIKQKDYQQAIAYLVPIAQSQSHRSSGIRAQMGLVVAYEHTGEVEEAIAICRTLTQHSNHKVKNWASHHLQQLLQRHPQPEVTKTPNSPLKETGFVPFEPTLQSTKNQLKTPKKETGFIPFNPTPAKPPQVKLTKNTPSDSTSKKPKTSKPQDSLPSVPPIKSPKIVEKIEDYPTKSSDSFSESKSQDETQTETVHSLNWRQAERATQWRRLKPLNLIRFRIEQVLTVYAFLWFLPRFVEFLIDTTNDLLRWLPFVKPIPLFYYDPTQFVYSSLFILFFLSPWLLDGILSWCYGMKPLPRTTLFKSSPEANKILRSYCQQHNWKVPPLKVLPTDAPLAMTYGFLPRFARIVVSQGLLEKLSEDEIALIYAREIYQFNPWNLAVMSLVTILTQIPYFIYSQLPNLAEHFSDLFKTRWLSWIPDNITSMISNSLKIITWVISLFSYGIYWILRWPALWISRRRVYYSDRIACNLTGNPNGLTRALLKISIGMSQSIQKDSQTSTLLEGFEFLMPMSYKQALTFGSLATHQPIESLLQWDIVNPHHKWMTLNHTHPLIGDRLLILSLYANFWQLETELDLSPQNTTRTQAILSRYSKLLLQGAPYFGVPLGLMMGSLIWLIGGIFTTLGVWQLEWLFGDFWILAGCIPLGCSLGIFFRINAFFPDIKPTTQLSNPSLADLYTSTDTLPVDSQVICLEGKLLGRPRLSNLLTQDLMLQTTGGLVKLHYIPLLTPLANLWFPSTHPVDFCGETVKVTGWWRRGATPWIDVETLQTQDGKINLAGGHPIWSTILACMIAFWGAYMISQGGF